MNTLRRRDLLLTCSGMAATLAVTQLLSAAHLASAQAPTSPAKSQHESDAVMVDSGEKATRSSTDERQMIRVQFATNRNQTSGDELFGSSFRVAPPLFVTGTIDVHHEGGNPLPNWVPDPKSLQIDPIPKAASSSIPQAVLAAPSASDAMTGFVEGLLDKSPDYPGIVFMPGFNSTFKSAMSSSAQIASAYEAGRVFCVSWPSEGEFGLNPYLTDKNSAYASGAAIAIALSSVFSKLLSIEKSKRPNLRIVCHSMGNRALGSAIQHISISAPDLLAENYFEYALLMAADEDFDALEQQTKLKSLLTLASNIGIYTNESDAAMFLSSIVNRRSPLGSFGPANFGSLPDKVTWIDCSDVGNTHENDGSSDWGHQYFRNSQLVVADVRQVLQGVPPERIVPRIPDGQFPTRKFVIPFSNDSAWARERGYKS
jgi:esterase/lipase superfamily enzyme